MFKDKKFWIGLVLSVICLYFFSRKINPHELWSSLQKANYIYLIPSIFFLLLSFYFRAIRWRVFLLSFGDIPVNRLMSPLMIGFMGNSLFPARLGELIRAYVLTKKEKVPFSASIATVVVERIFDILIILFFLVLLLVAFPLPPYMPDEGLITKTTLRNTGYVSGLLCLIGFIILIVFRYKTESCLKILHKLFKPLPEKLRHTLVHLADEFSEGLSVFHGIKGILLSLIYSLLVWIAVSCGNYFVLRAFHLESLPPTAAVFVLVLIAFGVALPSAPAYIGIYHIACQIALEVYGVQSSEAGSVAWVLWSSQVIPVVTIGLYYLWKENMSLKQLQEIKE